MRAIIIDNETTIEEHISQVFGRIAEFKILGNYADPRQGFNEVIEYRPDVVFIEIELNEISGIDLAKAIKNKYKNVSIVLMSMKKEYAVKAFEIEAFDYLLKPLNKCRLAITSNRLQSLMVKRKKEQQIMVCSFGDLQFKWLNGNEYLNVKWRTRKTQELFAYLLHNQQNPVRKDILIEMLWSHVDAEKGQALLYSAIYQIRKTLKDIDCPIEIVSHENTYRLKTNKIKYDVSEWELAMDQLPPLNKNTLSEYIRVIKMYKGDYLDKLDYLWAEAERDLLHSIWSYHIQKVVAFLEERERHIDVIRIYHYVIEVCPYEENAHFELMKLSNETNNNEAVFHYYKNLEFILREELGTKPDIKIQNWYKYWLEKEALMSE